MSLSDALPTFLAEARGLLEEMEEALLTLRQTPSDSDAINALFRAAHTIKGSAGLFGLDLIVGFTHQAESVLDRVRNDEVFMGPELITLFLECRDHIESLIDLVEVDDQPSDTLRILDHELRGRLSQHLVSESDAASGASLPSSFIADPVITLSPDQGDTSGVWHISLRFGPEVLRNGMDPLSFIHYLSSLGDIVQIFTLTEAIPDIDAMDPEQCYLGFEIRLRSSVDKRTIEAVFDFVREDSEIRILPPDSHLPDFQTLMDALPADRHRLGEILVGCGAITQRELDQVLGLQQQDGAERPLIGEALIKEKLVHPEVVDVALERQKEIRRRQAQESRLLRVRADKLDLLINQVGELVIASAGLHTRTLNIQDGALMESVHEVSRLVEEIRDSAMNLRLVEIGETFNRFRRVVRDVCKETGKDIELQIEGGDTELDKSMVERLADPLTHLVRNAIDHGIEAPETRIERGKPAVGLLTLNAAHQSGAIVIEVCDDGGGLDRERILAKARERGLVAPDRELTDREVWNLIFEPGFSTAQVVSNLSGRGVGMDVVKRNIEALRGTVEIDSQRGQGSTFRIRLPLSLAIIDGFLICAAGNDYVVPLDAVLECLELPAMALSRGDSQLNLRGEVLPLLRLADFFGFQEQYGRRRNVVVVQWAGNKTGLLVDELKGQLQAVIKPLGPLFAGLPGVSGSTILGSGDVALVLDISGLMNVALARDVRSLKDLVCHDVGSRGNGLIQ